MILGSGQDCLTSRDTKVSLADSNDFDLQEEEETCFSSGRNDIDPVEEEACFSVGANRGL